MSKETERQLIELSMFYKTYQTKTLETIIQSVYNEKLKEMQVKNNEPLEQKIIELQKFQIQLQQFRQSCATQSTIDDCQIVRHLEAGLDV